MEGKIKKIKLKRKIDNLEKLLKIIVCNKKTG